MKKITLEFADAQSTISNLLAGIRFIASNTENLTQDGFQDAANSIAEISRIALGISVAIDAEN
ncbi:hypothetical protein Q765_03155 [Flavobacterium rivuli WB 3.3-2 = DSM 21788]|uniref:Uncharacterized protein n=1 Tax=Flavobacterium rivuli WB 3.3-2 = DSM 21788 TaxID=1121895 RepID=A0A0A2M9F3_9FLAO|nr:hypothetical protein [Flavobacterium rivuli]KGO88068.1 hypothetical protein Q765_03155 [Flavobacterium rivuli WB 3.3-2 = DSM 21788]